MPDDQTRAAETDQKPFDTHHIETLTIPCQVQYPVISGKPPTMEPGHIAAGLVIGGELMVSVTHADGTTLGAVLDPVEVLEFFTALTIVMNAPSALPDAAGSA